MCIASGHCFVVVAVDVAVCPCIDLSSLSLSRGRLRVCVLKKKKLLILLLLLLLLLCVRREYFLSSKKKKKNRKRKLPSLGRSSWNVKIIQSSLLPSLRETRFHGLRLPNHNRYGRSSVEGVRRVPSISFFLPLPPSWNLLETFFNICYRIC